MPTPLEYTNQDDFMKACVIKMTGEGKPQDQAIAACMNMWTAANTPVIEPKPEPSTKSKLKLLEDFRISLEKNGYKIQDDVIENLFKSLCIPYQKIETYLTTEQMTQVIFLIQLIGG